MVFTKQADFTKKVTDLIDNPSENLSPSEIKAYFDTPDEELKATINQLIDDLTISGAKNIGIDAINGLSGNNIQDIIASLKSLADKKIDNTGDFKGSWQGLTPQMIGAPEMNSARITAAESQLAEKAKQHWIDVTDGKYGAIGDGVTDDTVAFTKAVADITESSILYVPPGKYLITPASIGGISIYNKNNFMVIGYGATIFCSPLLINPATDSYRLIRLNNCSNFSVKGFHFIYQIDWSSTVDTSSSRLDQVFQVYADVNNVCENFDISGNVFEYNGPSLNNNAQNINSKLTILGLASLTDVGDGTSVYQRNIKNYRVRDNTFVNCFGRTIYCTLTETGVITGNKYREYGKVVKPDGSLKYFAESVGIRVLASKDVDVVGNTISCYSGDFLNGMDMGAIHAFEVSSGGFPGMKSENVNITGNTMNFHKCGGWLFSIGACDHILFANNIASVDDTSEATNAIFPNEAVVSNMTISNNTLKNFKTFYNFDSLTDSDYVNVIIKNNSNIWGNNSTFGFTSTSLNRAKIGVNYWSDKNADCKGYNRISEISAYRVPPLTGTFTVGDICYNTGFNENACPVVSWVYRRASGGVNYWSPHEFITIANSAPPTMPSDTNSKAQFVGLRFIDTATWITCTWDGGSWRKPDGTIRP